MLQSLIARFSCFFSLPFLSSLCSKPGKVVIILSGRFAGRKAVVVKAFDEGRGDRKFAHALVVGVDRAPKRITKAMGEKKKEKRMRVKPFAKFVNLNHVMPTRYSLDIHENLSKAVPEEAIEAEEGEAKKTALGHVKKALQDRYKQLADPKAAGDKASVGALYFFRKLKF